MGIAIGSFDTFFVLRPCFVKTSQGTQAGAFTAEPDEVSG
jgi:hypothetical protein